jgi:hypothetical protein
MQAPHQDLLPPGESIRPPGKPIPASRIRLTIFLCDFQQINKFPDSFARTLVRKLSNTEPWRIAQKSAKNISRPSPSRSESAFGGKGMNFCSPACDTCALFADGWSEKWESWMAMWRIVYVCFLLFGSEPAQVIATTNQP